MFDVYTQAGEFTVETNDEVLDLFDRYPFVEGNDFFTVGRNRIEYLEIFCVRGGFSLSFIREGQDDSVPAEGKFDKKAVRDIMIAFCRAEQNWLAARRHETTEAPPANALSPTSVSAATPITPKGCAALAVAMALGTILLALIVS